MKLDLLALIKLSLGAALLMGTVSCKLLDGNGFGRTQPIRFQDGIGTILESRCLECHNHVDYGCAGG